MKEYQRAVIEIILFDEDNVFCDASMEDQEGGDMNIDGLFSGQ